MALRSRLPSRVVATYYAYQATLSFGFFAPVFTIFLLARDLSYTEIALLSTESAILTVVGEVPSGYLGDRLGRRTSLLVSTTAMTLSIAGFVVAESFPAFVILYGLWALARVFRSGTGDAWLYETLRDRLNDERRFTAVRGRGRAVTLGVTVVATLAGGALYTVQPALPFAVSAGLHALGVPILLSFPKTTAFEDGRDGAVPVRATARVVREQLTAPGTRTVVAVAAVLFAYTNTVNSYVQPTVRDVVGLPVSLLGPLYAGFTLVSAVAGYYTGAVDAWLGSRRTVVLAAPLVILGVGLVTLFPLLAIPAFLAYKGAATLLRSVTAGFLNDRVTDAGRATTLSAASMTYALARLPLLVAAGAFADRRGPRPVFGAVAVVCLLAIALLWLATRRAAVDA
ncbi:MFS transporter [Halosegnis longus]|uniref:MFS transporter n=1 Tax=Halosegnis longus TaxID=2216012 RepID=A0AAJ4R945_9EURY|nr:MFS transporter [Halosegnis longus]RNJ26456.1 MFS transporter [Salella cibi]